MTERQIELIVEQKIDALDRRYMQGELTEPQYRAQVAAIDEWANDKYAEAGAVLVD